MAQTFEGNSIIPSSIEVCYCHSNTVMHVNIQQDCVLAVNWKSIHFCVCVLYFWPKAEPLSPNSWKLFPNFTISHTHTHTCCHWHWSSVWSSKKYVIYLTLKSLFWLSVNDKLSDSDFISSCQEVKNLFLLDYFCIHFASRVFCSFTRVCI